MTTANYDITQVIAEYDRQDEANAAKMMAARWFPELADKLEIEDTSDSWLNRHSWAVALRNGSNAECARVWDYLCSICEW